MKGKVASKVVDYAVEAEKQKLKKKAKKLLLKRQPPIGLQLLKLQH